MSAGHTPGYRVTADGRMSKSTPGPWAVNPYNARVDCAVESKIGGLLPVCQLLWPTDERSEAETEANARLIAAAPVLLEQHESANVDLYLLRRAIEEGDPKAELLLRVDDIIRRNNAAIAKAIGDSA